MIELQILFAAFVGGLLVAIVCEVADHRFHNRLIARIEAGNREIRESIREGRVQEETEEEDNE